MNHTEGQLSVYSTAVTHSVFIPLLLQIQCFSHCFLHIQCLSYCCDILSVYPTVVKHSVFIPLLLHTQCFSHCCYTLCVYPTGLIATQQKQVLLVNVRPRQVKRTFSFCGVNTFADSHDLSSHHACTYTARSEITARVGGLMSTFEKRSNDWWCGNTHNYNLS